jgi:hypothetical protein
MVENGGIHVQVLQRELIDKLAQWWRVQLKKTYMIYTYEPRKPKLQNKWPTYNRKKK